MIKRVESLPVLPKTVSAARIKALDMAYRDSVGIDMFEQKHNGQQTAFFGGIDGSFSLIASKNADFEELNEYFAFSHSAVYCDGDDAKYLNCNKKTVSELYELENALSAENALGHCGIAQVYCKLQNGLDGDIVLPPFEHWYADFCIRFNHLAAEYAASENGVAVCGFMTEEISLITGVAVAENSRGKDEGTRVLSALIHNVRKKYPHSRIFASTVSAAEFYQKNGFKRKGTVAVCEF